MLQTGHNAGKVKKKRPKECRQYKNIARKWDLGCKESEKMGKEQKKGESRQSPQLPVPIAAGRSLASEPRLDPPIIKERNGEGKMTLKK